ncbi:S-layer homology domain-containing protein [Paenibacillus wynnii]|uniref:S-layer homology domain-containing protein n=1 Tax=Paenibacillus wynnii TaxID=268407 RepID=UPI002790B23F|nr:S-layer homology domain-containing protein [Paenibacillus wynnii]MDQ0192464.1 hypothetical protein [Paenibacillus wynnii]
MMKRAIPSILVVVMTFLIINSAVFGANEIKNQNMADILKQLQLFQGSNQGYELDKVFTRAQGAVMLLRLLGWEDEAVQYGGHSKFTDVRTSHWAAATIAYASSKGLVKGVTNLKFAPNEVMNGSQFITLTLRALGYTNAEPRVVLDLAITSGLLEAETAKNLIGKKVFLRDDMVAVAYSALQTKMFNSDMTLLQKLVDIDHTVAKEAALVSGLYRESPTIQNSSDPMDQIEAAIRKALHP